MQIGAALNLRFVHHSTDVECSTGGVLTLHIHEALIVVGDASQKLPAGGRIGHASPIRDVEIRLDRSLKSGPA